ncbi:MAG: serine protease [Solidesulfovibrio sp.]|uniref:S1C family serine protease n=1 Tax=Solidesulfovibrio sp. TaxID=2910990 RepID=UPI002B217B71|nr:serine protease [Solidesulfovibrio sp.]MEA4856964.1 serine protease [Solidesulfovibrio sp.]
MKYTRVLLLGCLLSLPWPASSRASDLSALFQANEASVVTIRAGKKIGTGFYVSPEFLVTNFHVIRGSRSVTYYNNYADGGTAVTSVVTVDPVNDLAILLAPKPGKPVRLGAYDSVSPGAELFAIGSPQGYEKTITNGMLSQKRKDGRMQISIAVSPGSSGSPVFTMQGDVVGVVVAQRTDSQNLNFAIPSDRVQNLLQKANATARADHINVADSDFSRDADSSGGVAGSMDVDFAGVDTSLPGCRNYASTAFETSTASLIKLCVCNESSMLTNRLCQCRPCRR